MSLFDRYAIIRGLSTQFSAAMRHRLEEFSAWRGGAATLDDLDDEVVSRWVASLQQQNARSPKTIKEYRAAVLALWRWAYDERLTDRCPGRVRQVKVPRPVPEAWTVEEIRQMLEACDRLSGRVPNTQIPQQAWFPAFIRLAYASGLRLGDLLALRRSQIDSNGHLRHVTQKTMQALTLRLPASCVASLAAIPWTGEHLLPWPGSRREFYDVFGRLIKLAGVRRGTTRWLRRSAASYVERDNPGAARVFLAHRTAGMAERHYLDPSITGRVPPGPPEL